MNRARITLTIALVFAAIALLPRTASAFCGFYVSGADTKLTNDATRVVLMRDGTRTVLSMQNAYKGPLNAFAMVVPVPVVLQKENVKVLKLDAFDKIDDQTAPRLVEYWEEDPCQQANEQRKGGGIGLRGIGGGSTGSGSAAGVDLGVRIEAQFEVGEYEIVILSAKDSAGLDTWLHQENYKIPDGAEPYLRPYVQAGSKFFVAKVNPQKVHFTGDRADLSPLRFFYDSEQFNLPVRLGLLNSSGKQDLLVYILAPSKRYQVANYDNVTMPTNIDVNDSVRTKFSSFYAAMFDGVIEKNPHTIVTEYAWDAQTCDPCPVPPLEKPDLATLGGDVIPSATWGAPGSVAPQVTVTTGPIHADVNLPNAERVIAGIRAKMRACYATGLRDDPSQSGTFHITATVAPNGEVAEATAVPAQGAKLSPQIMACASRAVRNMEFTTPGQQAKINWDVTVASDAVPGDGGAPSRVLVGLPRFTITRLHARYSKDSLGEDLVFREAPPIVGGREEGETLDTIARPSTYNAFQARYIIRHPWSGSIACKNPVRGVWGGPPGGGGPGGFGNFPTTTPARKLATVSREGISLASFVKGGNTSNLIGTPLANPPLPEGGAPPSAPTQASTATPTPSASTSTDGADASTAPAGSGVEQKRGCGCATIGARASARDAALAVFLVGGVVFVRRRRRRPACARADVGGTAR